MPGFKLSVIAATAALAAVPLALPQAANAQIDVQIGTMPPPPPPPRGGAWGDRDRDGVPNQFDRSNNNRPSGWSDQDRDGVPNRYDRDRDGDGVPNRYDRSDNNPYRR